MTHNFCALNLPPGALELPWKFGDNRPTRSWVMSGQTNKHTDRQTDRHTHKTSYNVGCGWYIVGWYFVGVPTVSVDKCKGTWSCLRIDITWRTECSRLICWWCMYTDYRTCTKQMRCSQQCVRQYLSRYADTCTEGRTPTCQDYSRVHNGGPDGCRHSDTLSYWQRVENCCGRDCTSSATSSSDQRPAYRPSLSILMQMILPVALRQQLAVPTAEKDVNNSYLWSIFAKNIDN